jgi:hypothetical protein
MNSIDIVDFKLTAVELAKDSPIFLYAAFYEPFHSWLYTLATEMNPIVEFLLNCLALGYGIYRVYKVYSRWKNDKKNNGQIKLF